MRSFRDASVQTTVVVTIALFVMCIGIAQKFWPPETGARLDPLLGVRARVHDLGSEPHEGQRRSPSCSPSRSPSCSAASCS